MEEVDEDVARWATGPGRDVIDRTVEHLGDGLDVLRIGTDLRGRGLTPARAAFVTAAAVTRLAAIAQGLPGAADLVLTREALEQASHPAAAAWRARRAATAATDVGAGRLQDRCAGTGGDAVAMAAHLPVLAVERDPGRAVLAADRAEVLGVEVEVVVADALDPQLPTTGEVVHADPDRRDASGRRARRLAHHAPSVPDLIGATAAAAGRLVTVAPGVAWDDGELPDDAEVVFLQQDGRLLEAVLCTGAARAHDARATAVLLDAGQQRSRAAGPRDRLPVGEVGSHLLLPATAAVRARLHDQLGREVEARRLSARRALLTSDHHPGESPWLTAEQVEAVLPGRPRALRDHLRDHPGRRVELVLHGVDVEPRSWLRAAGDPPTGPEDLRVHLVRREHDAIAVCTTRTGVVRG